MITSAVFPARYVQGVGAIDQLGMELQKIGTTAVILVDPFVDDNFSSIIDETCRDKINLYKVRFTGECSDLEINRIIDEVKAAGITADIAVAIGGGKTIDATRAFASKLEIPTAIVPTIAATDAPCSGASIIYTEAGEFQEILISRSPLLVLIDTQIVANAPVRFLVSGMGDALATWFEAEECGKSFANTMAGNPPTRTALALARLSYDILLEFGVLAKEACIQKVVTPALEHIVEANTLLSGLGFENGGLSGAHSIHDALTTLEQTHTLFHGEKVAFGTLVLLAITDRPAEQIAEVFHFCEEIGLPTTLADINLENVTDEELISVAKAAVTPGYDIHKLSQPVVWQDVYAAIKATNAYGIKRKKNKIDHPLLK